MLEQYTSGPLDGPVALMPTLAIGPYRFSPGLVTTLAALVVLALLVRLGAWQLSRAQEKESMLENARTAGAAAPVELSVGSVDAGLEQRQARGAGRYDLARQYLLDNQVHRGQAGYHVLTPLRIAPGQGWILVNRGWVPVGPTRDVLPSLPGPDARVSVAGTLAGPPSTGLLLGDSGYDGTRWPRLVQTVDLARIGAELPGGVAPLLLLLDPGEAHGFERDWPVVRGIGPERHRAYAFQWFALALTLMVIYVVVNTSRAR